MGKQYRFNFKTYSTQSYWYFCACHPYLGSERGSGKIQDEQMSFRSKRQPSPYVEKERYDIKESNNLPTARGFMLRKESEDQQAYAVKPQPSISESQAYLKVFFMRGFKFKSLMMLMNWILKLN